MNKALMMAALLCCTAMAQEKGAEALVRSTQSHTTLLDGRRRWSIQWDSVPEAVSYDLIIRDGITEADPIIAETTETRAASDWLMLQPAYRSRVRSVWVRSVGADGQKSEWAGPVKFIKIK